MRQAFDERMGVMKNLVEQNTDAANKRCRHYCVGRRCSRSSRATPPGAWISFRADPGPERHAR